MAAENRTRPFHERFEIEVGVEEARRRFINRISNAVFDRLMSQADRNGVVDMGTLYRRVRYILGEGPRAVPSFDHYVGYDFYRCLRVLEALFQSLEGNEHDKSRYGDFLTIRIIQALQASEIDLGIDWQPPIFVPTGARLLDERLVNEQLHWLSEPQYRTVYEPFEKGLSHFLEAEKKPQLLTDVVTDMYESVEALAKIVTGRPSKDLSGNAEMFISKVKASDHYKKLLKEYIAYANEFRHAAQEGKPRSSLSRAEAESFVYLTGLFIRLAIQRS